MKYIITLSLFFISLLSYGQIDKQKTADINKLLVVSGSKKNVETGLTNMIAIMKKNPAYEGLPDDFWDNFLQEINLDEFMQMYVPIYDKYYTHNEIKDIIAFYESPTGKKMMESTPKILTESMNMGREWGMKIGMKVAEKMKKE